MKKKTLKIVGWGTMYNEPCIFCGESGQVYIDGFPFGEEGMSPACNKCLQQYDQEDLIVEALNKVFK